MPTIPFLKVKTNALDALLATLGYRLTKLAKDGKDEDFMKLINNKSLVLQFSSQDGVARYFEFDQGKVRQSLGKADSADLMIDFKDSFQGAKLLALADTVKLMSAIQEGDVVVTGDYKLVLWFAGLAKIATQVPDKYKPYLDQAKPYLNQAKPYATKVKNTLSTLLNKIKNS